MSFTIHLNAVILAGVASVPVGVILLCLGLVSAFGTGRGSFLAALGWVLVIGGIGAVLIGAGMAIR